MAPTERRRRTSLGTEPAFDQLLRRLTAAEIEFVLIGGLAVDAWGVVRGTANWDVVQGLGGVPTYDELLAGAIEADVLGIKVLVCSGEDLKAMKQTAGRMRDQAGVDLGSKSVPLPNIRLTTTRFRRSRG